MTIADYMQTVGQQARAAGSELLRMKDCVDVMGVADVIVSRGGL